jgi:hypothetical protein
LSLARADLAAFEAVLASVVDQTLSARIVPTGDGRARNTLTDEEVRMAGLTGVSPVAILAYKKRENAA